MIVDFAKYHYTEKLLDCKYVFRQGVAKLCIIRYNGHAMDAGAFVMAGQSTTPQPTKEKTKTEEENEAKETETKTAPPIKENAVS